jgi:hypothetical protein
MSLNAGKKTKTRFEQKKRGFTIERTTFIRPGVLLWTDVPVAWIALVDGFGRHELHASLSQLPTPHSNTPPPFSLLTYGIPLPWVDVTAHTRLESLKLPDESTAPAVPVHCSPDGAHAAERIHNQKLVMPQCTCASLDRNLHPRMPLVPTPPRLKRACM